MDIFFISDSFSLKLLLRVYGDLFILIKQCSIFISFPTEPGPVDSLDAIPMGSSAFFLIWKKPKQPNGILTGYHIYYQVVEGTETGPMSERDPPINDPMVTRAKLASLKPATKYRITIRARTAVSMNFRVLSFYQCLEEVCFARLYY